MKKTITCTQCNHKQSPKWQFCHKCLNNLYPDTSLQVISAPPWTSIRNNEASKMDADYDTRKVEQMIEIREKEVRTSRKLRNWEADRKKEIMNYKPTWVKRGRKASELPK